MDNAHLLDLSVVLDAVNNLTSFICSWLLLTMSSCRALSLQSPLKWWCARIPFLSRLLLYASALYYLALYLRSMYLLAQKKFNEWIKEVDKENWMARENVHFNIHYVLIEHIGSTSKKGNIVSWVVLSRLRMFRKLRRNLNFLEPGGMCFLT